MSQEEVRVPTTVLEIMFVTYATGHISFQISISAVTLSGDTLVYLT